VRTALRPAVACLTAAALGAAIATGCGGDDGSDTVQQSSSPSGAPESPDIDQPLSQAELHGRDLFVEHCGACHTLDAAGTVGNVGPDLGDISITEEDILTAIRTGGGRHSKGNEPGPTGTMPRNLVTGSDARDVAAFVAANAGGSSTP